MTGGGTISYKKKMIGGTFVYVQFQVHGICSCVSVLFVCLLACENEKDKTTVSPRFFQFFCLLTFDRTTFTHSSNNTVISIVLQVAEKMSGNLKKT